MSVRSGAASLTRLAEACTRDPEQSIRAIGWNLLRDHRVSDARAEHFLEVTRQPTTASDLKRALGDYHYNWVCRQPAETYLSRARNSLNFVADGDLSMNMPLATVINVSGWIAQLRDTVRDGPRLEQIFDEVAVVGTPTRRIADFLSALFAVVNVARDQRPVWAARLSRFRRAIDRARPATWNAAVGVWRRQGSWQAVVTYPRRSVQEVIRPTQLDAGFYQFHFPSPPVVATASGGITMAICDMTDRMPLVPEWIHPPIDFDADHWLAAGGLFGEVPDALDVTRLGEHRRSHGGRLTKWLDGLGPGWLPPE